MYFFFISFYFQAIAVFLRKYPVIMKKYFNFLLAALTVSVLTACQSKEDKALKLIEADMFRTLYDFESYEPIETQIDSAYTEALTDSTVRSYALEALAAQTLFTEAMEDFEDALDDMNIWMGAFSSYSRNKFKEANDRATSKLKEAETYSSKQKEAENGIREAAKGIKKEFKGWKVTHKFRCKTKGGLPSIGDYVYYIDPKFKTILNSYDIDDETYQELNALIENALTEEPENDTEENTI